MSPRAHESVTQSTSLVPVSSPALSLSGLRVSSLGELDDSREMKDGSFWSLLVPGASVSLQNLTSCSALEGPGTSPSSWTQAASLLKDTREYGSNWEPAGNSEKGQQVREGVTGVRDRRHVSSSRPSKCQAWTVPYGLIPRALPYIQCSMT